MFIPAPAIVALNIRATEIDIRFIFKTRRDAIADPAQYARPLWLIAGIIVAEAINHAGIIRVFTADPIELVMGVLAQLLAELCVISRTRDPGSCSCERAKACIFALLPITGFVFV